jgi:cytochrome c-type biogenesis protein
MALLSAVSWPTAVLAGLISFFSPCVLPLAPIYLGYMTGHILGRATTVSRWRSISHALCFVLGFGAVFVALGATAGAIGRAAQSVMPLAARMGGLLLILFGLQMTGLLKLPWLNADKRVQLSGKRVGGAYVTSTLMGIVFAAGWTPCVGPVLAGILLLAADGQQASQGALLLAGYALGLGAPFVALAAFLDVLGPWLKRLNRYLRWTSVLGGILLMGLGLLLVAERMDLLLAG